MSMNEMMQGAEPQRIPDKWQTSVRLSVETAWTDFALVVIGGFFLTVARGVVILVGNQNAYFLYGMRLFNPDFIPQDWYTWGIFHYHFAFGYLLYFLQVLGPLDVMVVVAQFAIMTVLCVGLLLLCKRFCQYPVHVYLAVVVWLGIVCAWEVGLGWQQLISGYFQPSEVAASLMVLGLALLLERNFLVAGIVLGLAGLFHGSFLISFGPTIFVTALAVGVWRDRKQLLSFGVPLGGIWLVFVAVVAHAYSQSPPPDANIMSIMMDFRNPEDLKISQWPLAHTYNWLALAVMGAIAVFTLPKESKSREFRICFLAATATCLIGVLQATLIKIPAVTILLLWRVSTLVTLFGLIVALDRYIHLTVRSGGGWEKGDRVLVACLFFVFPILLIHGWGVLASKYVFIWMVIVPCCAMATWVLKRVNKKFNCSMAIVVAIFLLLAVRSYRGVAHYSNYMENPCDASLGMMEEWVRNNTASDAIFVIPPYMQYMRTRARRAVVVDWTATCHRPSDLAEWFKRICAVSGMDEHDPTREKMKDGYARFDTNRASLLNERYGADYVVILRQEHRGDLSGLIERFRNDEYGVFEIPGPKA